MFGASDKPLPPDELQAACLAQYPLVIGGVVPVVKLDRIKSGQLNFTGEHLPSDFLICMRISSQILEIDLVLFFGKIGRTHRENFHFS